MLWPCRHHARLQPRRHQTISYAAVGCSRVRSITTNASRSSYNGGTLRRVATMVPHDEVDLRLFVELEPGSGVQWVFGVDQSAPTAVPGEAPRGHNVHGC